MSAKETKGGTWINVNGNEQKGHVNIYDKDPRGKHDTSIHVNINYEEKTFNITEKEEGEKTTTDCSCYLTTACMKYLSESFNDNCHELRILRWFRDNFVSKEEIEHYYTIAPIIVETINKNSKCDEIYRVIYENVIYLCVRAIENGNYRLAYDTYRNSILSLEEKYVRPILKQKLVKVLKSRINYLPLSQV